MGVDVLSMGPAKFGEVRLVVRRFTLNRARELAREALEQESENQVRGLLRSALEAASFLKHRPEIGGRADSGTRLVPGESNPPL